MRQPVFILLALSELLSIVMFVYMRNFRTGEETGFSEEAVQSAIWNVAPPLAIRVILLTLTPHWFGRYADDIKKA
jgi:hypothetical protein